MQRRYTAVAAVALVALVLIPCAALAAGFSSGFGPKSSPLDPKILAQGPPDWAGNASALRANATDGAGTGTCLTNQARDKVRTQLSDSTCLGDQARDCDLDRTQLRDGTCLTNQVCDGDQDRAQLRDRTATPENGKRFALQDRLQHGRGR